MQADMEASDHLQACLVEERQQAAADRSNLLTQISNLVNKSGEEQEARLEARINAIRTDITTSKTGFASADKTYNDGMDQWLKKEHNLVEDVLKSRDTLKSKMKKDWTVSDLRVSEKSCTNTVFQAINEHNTNIQTTTKSVHEETIRIVDAQMKDMTTQMQALDDFVTRARSQNEVHHTGHVQSLQNLASTVNDSYSSIGDHFQSTYARVRDLGTNVSSHISTLQSSLPPLNETIAQPLSSLRTTITDAPLKEYTPTGETPQKTTYHIPSTLPRTEPHDKLLAKHFLRQQAISPYKTSPSKGLIYTDSHTTTSAPPSPTKPSLLASSSSGLKEVDMNVALNPSAPVSRHSDSAITSAEPTKSDRADFSKSINADFSKSVGGVGGGMGPPPFKRQHTMGSGESKLPTKFGGKGAGVGLRGGGVEGGKENVQSQQGRRLLRSSHSHSG